MAEQHIVVFPEFALLVGAFRGEGGPSCKWMDRIQWKMLIDKMDFIPILLANQGVSLRVERLAEWALEIGKLHNRLFGLDWPPRRTIAKLNNLTRNRSLGGLWCRGYSPTRRNPRDGGSELTRATVEASLSHLNDPLAGYRKYYPGHNKPGNKEAERNQEI